MTGAEFRGVDIDLLADYIGGALTGTPDEPVVVTLIADDPAWRAAYESLSGGMEAVGAELAAFEPEPMPDDLIARLDAALAEPGPRLTLVPGDPAQDVHQADLTKPERGTKPGSARRLRWATPIAVAAGVIAFVGFGLDYLAGRDSAQSDTAAAGAAADSAERNAAKIPAPAQVASGTDYTSTTLSSAPLRPLTMASGGAESRSAPLSAPDKGGAALGGDSSLGRLHDATALQECLDAIAAQNNDGAIFADTVDFARFNGAPAIVVRFSSASGSWAWAAGPACGTDGDANTLAKSPVR
ncbi:hypothetical protein GCM10010172_53560 [Paractinoplanes ferrugineus]|uniref:Uncharacterized protein n=1 Tax=Paractinoplanes ferrugineus TaxID=113564 RepID=A0A919J759_9ACTN|nr:hypothetical protein [Actinoplanes ferrugineus]GIE11826.1 hypothetical protein Afe05nite_36660 [Actinoplanes ferrugineus]